MNRYPALFVGLIAVVSMFSGCASPGVKAADRGDAVELQQILDQPNNGNENLEKLLSESIWSDCSCPECARTVLKMGVKPTRELLAEAASQGSVKCASVLMDYGAEPTGAMAYIESYPTRVYSIEERQRVTQFFRKLEQDRASKPPAPAPLAAQSAPAPAAAEPARSRATPLFHEAERPDDYALIIGIEKYGDLPAATYAERDAAAAADFAAAMGVPALNISTLTDDHATRAGLAKKLEGWLANNVNEKSTVYFYYSGHGAPDTKTGQAYLVPFDGDPEYLEQTAYPLKRLYEKLGALKAKRVIVMLDSCFSGAGGRSVLAKGARPLVAKVDTCFSSGDGKISVLAAAGAEQISGTSDEKGHGLFSYYLFNGLNGGAKDASGQVTLQSLFDYLKPKVMEDARRANRDQVPQLQSDAATASVTVLRGK
jgi:hypothetical protein